MLKKMRQRVIVAAMLAFFAVIMLIGVSVNVVNYMVVTRNADETLSAILSFEENTVRPEMKNDDPDILPPDAPEQNPAPREGMPPFMGLPDLESNYMTRFFIVRFGEDGNPDYISIDYIASVGDEDALTLAKRVYEKNSDHGYMGDYRYVCNRIGNEGVVVFLNTVREQKSMKNLLLMTIAISGISLAIVFILVALFSKRAIRPIAKNIEQQKQFITDASHELKTPLTSISTSLDVIAMERGEEE